MEKGPVAGVGVCMRVKEGRPKTEEVSGAQITRGLEASDHTVDLDGLLWVLPQPLP